MLRTSSRIVQLAIGAVLLLSQSSALSAESERMPLPATTTEPPTTAEGFYQLGVELRLKNQMMKSRDALLKAIDMDKTGPVGKKATFYFNARLPKFPITEEMEGGSIKAGFELSRGEFNHAIAILEQYVAKYPNSEWLYSNLSRAYLDRGYPQKAITAAKKAVAINPSYLHGWTQLERAYRKAAEPTLAAEAEAQKVKFSSALIDEAAARERLIPRGQRELRALSLAKSGNFESLDKLMNEKLQTATKEGDHKVIAEILSYKALSASRNADSTALPEALKKALVSSDTAYGTDSIQSTILAVELTNFLVKTDQVQDAAELYERLRKTYESRYPDSLLLANLLERQADIFDKTGSKSEAEKNRLTAKAMMEKHQSRQTYTASMLKNKSEPLSAEYFKAMKVSELQETLNKIEAAKRKDELPLADAKFNLGMFYLLQGKHTEAEPLLQSAFDLRVGKLGANSPEAAVVAQGLAMAMHAQDKEPQATELMENANEALLWLMALSQPEEALRSATMTALQRRARLSLEHTH